MNAALRRALWIRDRGCAFPGCTHTRYVHAHHIIHWLHGGKTSLENLILLCSGHHRLLHEGGFSIERLDDGTIQFRNARGEVIDQVIVANRTGSTPAVSPEDLTSPTYFDQVDMPPAWDGTAMDYPLAVHVILDDGAEVHAPDGGPPPGGPRRPPSWIEEALRTPPPAWSWRTSEPVD